MKKTCVVSWLLLGVFQTGERLLTTKKSKSAQCVLCHCPLDDRLHFMLSCPLLNDIREDFICQMVANCPPLMNYLEHNEKFLIAIIDPESPKLPLDISSGWIDIPSAYQIGRNFVYSMYLKRRYLINQLSKASAINFEEFEDDFFEVNI